MLGNYFVYLLYNNMVSLVQFELIYVGEQILDNNFVEC